MVQLHTHSCTALQLCLSDLVAYGLLDPRFLDVVDALIITLDCSLCLLHNTMGVLGLVVDIVLLAMEKLLDLFDLKVEIGRPFLIFWSSGRF